MQLKEGPVGAVRSYQLPRYGNLANRFGSKPIRRKGIIMNTLSGWNPLTELNEMQNRLSNIFGRGVGGHNGDKTLGLPDWSPLVDVTEDDNEFLIKAELPEVKKEDVKVCIEGGMVRISGERKFETEEKGKKYHRVERAYGSFERSFSLPDSCKPETMTAEYRDGMLTLHVPKNKEAAPKAIDVKVQ